MDFGFNKYGFDRDELFKDIEGAKDLITYTGKEVVENPLNKTESPFYNSN